MPTFFIRRCLLSAFFCLLIGGANLIAAPIMGTVEEISAEDSTITIKLAGKKDASVDLKLAPNVTLQLDGKKARLTDVAVGQTVTAVVNAEDFVTKLTLKSSKTTTEKKAPPKRSGFDKKSDEAVADYWPQYRGPQRDNISQETGLLQSWPESGPAVAWQQRGLGEGYSSVSIARGRLYTMGNQNNDEMVLALDASNGQPLWSARTGGSAYREGQGNGPRGTPTIDEDRVYALGATGDLVCLSADKGNVIWQKNILAEYGGDNIQWGISESVLIDGKNLICSPGGKAATMVALDKATGREVWKSLVEGTPRAAYSSPILIDFSGDRMYVNFVHTAVVAIRAKDGNVLWGNAASANDIANCSTPLYSDGRVFTASGYGKGSAMFKLAKGGKATLGYASKEMANHHGGMVVLDGYVYGFDDQILKCIDLKTGKPTWQNRSVGKGSLTYADGHLYLRSENGPVALCSANPKQYEEVGRFEPPNRSDRHAWSHPVVCGGRLFLRDMDSLVVYDVKQ